MKNLLRMLVLQFSFFTTIPLPTVAYSTELFQKGFPISPLTGLITGGGCALLLLLFGALELPFLGVAFSLLLGAMLTGGLHLDGLADSADGFLSGRSPERCREIMRDSRIGTQGALALIMLLLCKGAVLLSLFDTPLLLPAAAVLGRMSAVLLSIIAPYARPEGGLGAPLIGKMGRREAGFSALLGLLLSLLLTSFRGAFILWGAALLCSFFMASYSKKKIGGVTGDVLGAQIELVEVFLLCLALLLQKGGVAL